MRWEVEAPVTRPVHREGDFYVCEVDEIREHAMLVIPAVKQNNG
jgi:hypothetical protein